MPFRSRLNSFLAIVLCCLLHGANAGTAVDNTKLSVNALVNAPVNVSVNAPHSIKESIIFSETISSSQKKYIQDLLANVSTKIVPKRIIFVAGGQKSSWRKVKKSLVIEIKNDQGIELQREVLRALALYFDKTNKISTRKEWKKISQWRSTKIFPLLIEEHPYNADVRGFVSKQAMENARIDFIESVVEYGLPHSSTVQESMKCRLSEKYLFISSLFSDWSSPLESIQATCNNFSTGFVSDLRFLSVYDQKPLQSNTFDASQVTGFELLYATPGAGDVAEIAGHLLLRIKFTQDVNNKDGMQDMVVSFLANTEQESAPQNRTMQQECKKNWLNLLESEKDFDAFSSIKQSIKGLSGLYLSTMERQTMAQAIKNYTIEEDRNLLRYELILTDEQQIKLLEHIHSIKNNFNARYYFFKQNCASVLVNEIGVGINNSTITDFHPLVSPPHSLVNLFISEGLARPVFPSYLSYRQKGFLAKEYLLDTYKNHDLVQINQNMFSRSEKKRLAAIKEVMYWREDPALNDELYKIASLLQESEMIHSHKDLICKDYTSTVTAFLRQFQKEHLHRAIKQPTTAANNSFVPDINYLAENYKQKEWQAWQNNKVFTGHYQFALVMDQTERMNESSHNKLLGFDFAAHHQEMGSASPIAMQRSSYVDFFRWQYLKHGSEFSSQYNLLNIRKFKQQLSTVEPIYDSYRQLGIGLAVANGSKDNQYSDIEWLRADALINLLSSANYDKYLFASIGLSANRRKFTDLARDYSIDLPLAIEGLYSAGDFKFRARVESTTLFYSGDFLKTTSSWSLGRMLGSKSGYCQRTSCSLMLEQEHQYYKQANVDSLKRNRVQIRFQVNHW